MKCVTLSNTRKNLIGQRETNLVIIYQQYSMVLYKIIWLQKKFDPKEKTGLGRFKTALEDKYFLQEILENKHFLVSTCCNLQNV